MSKPKLPPLSEVLALAEQADCRVSITDLARMHKHGEMSAEVVDALWPDASPRVKAAYMGLKRYQSEPCPRCGGTQRYTGGTNCVGCVAANRERYYAENPEKKAEILARWRAENRAYYNLSARVWRAKNPDKVKQNNLRCRAKKREMAA